MTSMSLAAAGNRVMASWEEAGQVYCGGVDGTGTVPAPAAAPGAGDGREHPRLAIASEASRCLYGRSGRVGRGEAGIAWQVFDGAGRPPARSGRPFTAGLELRLRCRPSWRRLVVMY